MDKIDLSDPKWWLGFILSILAYLLVDAHKNIKIGISKKADKDGMDALEQRHKDEMARLERMFESRINTMERNLGDRIDLVLRILEHKGDA